MVKKVFALASVTALSGLMVSMVAAGCSSTITVPDVDSSTADTGPVKDSSRPDTNAPDTSMPGTCPTTDPIDTSSEPYKTPAAPQVGACNDTDLKAMEAVVKAGNLKTLADLVATGVSATCKACAVTDATAAAWGPAVSNVTIDGKMTDIFNVGACVGIVSGKDACGKAFAEYDDCTNTACTDCADTAKSACFTKAAQNACQPQVQALITACGGQAPAQAYVNQCNNAGQGGCTSCAGTGNDIYYQFEEYVVQQCVHDPRTADGGLDGG